MKWIKINRDNLPEYKLLAANFKPGSYGYKEKIIGHLHIGEHTGCVCCENEYELLDNVTHFYDINNDDI